MMKLSAIDLFAIFQIYLMIEQTSSAIFFDIGNSPRVAQYTRLRDASVYRGMLLSLSPEQKNEMCEDFYSVQLYVNSYTEEQIADTKKTIRLLSDSFTQKTLDEKLKFDIEIRSVVEDFETGLEKKKELVMRCFGRNFSRRSAGRHLWYHVISAFQPKWLFYGFRKNPRNKLMTLLGFITLSPDLAPLEQSELETNYVTMRRTLKILSEESPEYMNQIKNREALSALSEEHEYILCASILSSAVYRDERLEFSHRWMDSNKDPLNVSKNISFKNSIYVEEKLEADCILCRAFKYGGTRSSEPQNLYLTSNYDNENSLIVLKEEGDHVYVDKHFKNIPLLITGKKMEHDLLLLNYSGNYEVQEENPSVE